MTFKYSILLSALLLGGALAHAQTAPTLEVVPQANPARPGDPFTVTLKLSWAGDPNQWAVLPPEVDDVEWGTVGRGTAELLQRDGVNVHVQRVTFTAPEPGDYETPEITVPYNTPRVLARGFAEERMPDPPEGAGPILRQVSAGTVNVVVRKPFPWMLVGGIAGLTLVLVGGGLIWQRSRTRQQEARRLARLAPVERAQTLLHEARRKRLDGDFYAFYQQLNAAVSVAQAHPDARALVTRLQERTREVGFKGIRPTEDELDGDAKAAEAVVDQWKKEMPG
jgi:hypothetical protein